MPGRRWPPNSRGLARKSVKLPDVAFTLAGRRPYDVRMAAVVADRADAAAVLTALPDEHGTTTSPSGSARRASRRAASDWRSCFPGRARSTSGWPAASMTPKPVFRESFDRCAAGFAEELGIDLPAEVFHGTGLEPTDLAQPALFAVEYALAQLIMSFGVTPAALAGHSIGELVAATVAGVFDLPTAIKVVSVRARLMHAAPAGAMVAVAANPEDIADHLSATDGAVDLAAINEVRQLRGGRHSGGDPGVHRSRCRSGHRGAPRPNLARVSFAVDGCGAWRPSPSTCPP